MDYQAFEQRVLELLYRTEVKLTVPYAAFRLRCSSSEAAVLLDEMVRRDVITMEVDENGVIYFDVGDRSAGVIAVEMSWELAAGPQRVQDASSTEQAVRRDTILRVLLPLALGPLGLFYSSAEKAVLMSVLFIAMLLLAPVVPLQLSFSVVWFLCIAWATELCLLKKTGAPSVRA